MTAATPVRRRITARDRMEVYKRDGGICQLCGDHVAMDEAHIDHIIPVSKGGRHTFSNFQLTHAACNIHKSNTVPDSVPRVLYLEAETRASELAKQVAKLQAQVNVLQGSSEGNQSRLTETETAYRQVMAVMTAMLTMPITDGFWKNSARYWLERSKQDFENSMKYRRQSESWRVEYEEASKWASRFCAALLFTWLLVGSTVGLWWVL